ncbi:MAG TPA: glycosyltransferase family 2 protein [Kiritimatiellia bacterium]|nr:glycosyltransferase family 2 protein [Kiritimatiellia bacterium]HRZ11685.1 glycosyltransferase family 2 protein [Kiritimatiellia bacterium]HSA16764.1 glycosyltransferase family 2 protein [Kiritimatiellia bacterium]
MTTTLFIPTLNEIESMRQILPRIRREWVDQILVVDLSTDGTAEYARGQGCEVVRQQVKGLRHAYREGFPHVRGDVVITFSPDGNSIPEVIPALIAKMKEGFDMVIASRYRPPAKSADDDWMTGFGNWLFTRAINLLHGHAWGRPYTDALVMFRAYRTSLYRELELDLDDGYAPERWFRTIMGVEPLLSVRAAKRRLKIGEVPADEPARIGGTRKLQLVRWPCAYMSQVIRETWRWRKKAGPPA